MCPSTATAVPQGTGTGTISWALESVFTVTAQRMGFN